MRCKNCNEQIEGSWSVCAYCGYSVSETDDGKECVRKSMQVKEGKENLSMSQTMQIKAKRHIIKPGMSEIKTDIKIISNKIHIVTNYNGRILKKEPVLQTFEMGNVDAIKFKSLPVLYFIDIVRIIIFVLLSMVTAWGGLAMALYFFYLTISKVLIIRLKDGSSIKVFLSQESDADEFVKHIREEDSTYNRASQRNDKSWTRTEFIKRFSVYLMALFVFVLGFCWEVTFAANESAKTEKEDFAETIESTEQLTEEGHESKEETETKETRNVETEGTTEKVTEGRDEPDNTYLIEDSNTRELTNEEVGRLTEDEKQMAINEIYARHGRMFNDSDIQEYFELKSWYKGSIKPEKFNDDDLLNQIEKNNIRKLFGNQTSETKNTITVNFAGRYYEDGILQDSATLEIIQNGNTISYKWYAAHDGGIINEEYGLDIEYGDEGAYVPIQGFFMIMHDSGCIEIHSGAGVSPGAMYYPEEQCSPPDPVEY